MIFGVIENEVEMRMEQLRKLDKEYASGNSYPECPRCEGTRTVEAITQINGDFGHPTIEYFNCPLCSAMGEADAEKAQDWLIEIVEFENMSEEDEKYLEERENIS